MCEVLLKSVKWVNDKLRLERSLQFNELVTNQYAVGKQEYTPWHSDTSPFLDDEGLIVSVTLGAPGVFCFAPFYGVESARKWYYKTEDTRKQCYVDESVRGCVDLWPGDLMLMGGTFQKHMAHKTLKISRINIRMFKDFPAMNPEVSASLQRLIDNCDEWRKHRIAITFRRIVNHSDGSAEFQTQFRCPLRPACG